MEDVAVIYGCSLFLLLRDKVGQEIMVTVSDPEVSASTRVYQGPETDLQPSNKCSLTKDLGEGSEEDYIKGLSDRLAGILGNLVQVHEGAERDHFIEPETAETKFTILGWLDAEEKVRYGLFDCNVVKL